MSLADVKAILYGLVCIVAIATLSKSVTLETSLVRLQPSSPDKLCLNCVAQRISLKGIAIAMAVLVIGDDANS